MKTNSTKEKQTAGNGMKSMSDMAEAALKNYEQAIRTGLKFQEEAGRVWSSMLHQANFGQDWQKRVSNVTGMANDLVPLAQRRLEDMAGLMEKNSRTGAELLKKAVDAAQTPAVAESQAKWMDFWAESLGAVRSNTETVTEISGKAIDSWINFMRKSSEVTEIRVPKAA